MLRGLFTLSLRWARNQNLLPNSNCDELTFCTHRETLTYDEHHTYFFLSYQIAATAATPPITAR